MSKFHAESFKATPFLAPIWLLFRPCRAFPRLAGHPGALGSPCGVVRPNEVNQARPRNDAIHLVKKDYFSGLAVSQRKTKRGLIVAGFYSMYFTATRPYSVRDMACFL